MTDTNPRQARREATDKLEPAVRAVIYEGLVGRIEEVDPGDTPLKAAVHALALVVEALDAADAAAKRLRLGGVLRAQIDDKLREMKPVTKLTTKAPCVGGVKRRGYGGGRGCGLMGTWTFDGEHRCKPHAEGTRDALVTELHRAAWQEIVGREWDYTDNWTPDPDVEQQVAAKLGLTLTVPVDLR